jgi:hypothetical protein
MFDSQLGGKHVKRELDNIKEMKKNEELEEEKIKDLAFAKNE